MVNGLYMGKKYFCLCFVVVLQGIVEAVAAQNMIHINQIGYHRDAAKVAMVTDMDGESFTVRLAKSNKVAYSGKLTAQRLWNMSGENIQYADFSDLKTPGAYYIQIGSERSYTFEVSADSLYADLALWSTKAFYLWRCSSEIKAKYSTFNGNSYARAAGHPDNVCYIHPSASTETHHSESEFSSPGGWYDAGDYGKYIVNSAISVAYLGMAYELNKDYYKRTSLNIPESGNKVPDLLDELKWEYDWMLTMQDEADGGVFFKVSTLKFSKMCMPSEDVADRYIFAKSTTSALDFAYSVALAARLFKDYEKEFPGYSKRCLDAALRAYEWAKKNKNIPYNNPKDCNTGVYGDDDYSDEFFTAACELFITTGDKKYYDDINLVRGYDAPTWGFVSTLGLMDLMINISDLPDYVNRQLIRSKMTSLFDVIYNRYYYSAGHCPLVKFEWGSNGDIATSGAIMGLAYRTLGNKKYLAGAQECFDYLLGRNSVDYCFVTGFGSRMPKHPHDRRCEADGIKAPLPGYLVGGANMVDQTDCGASTYPTYIYPARSYQDKICSHTTNEVAINWNSPLVLLTSIIVNAYKYDNK